MRLDELARRRDRLGLAAAALGAAVLVLAAGLVAAALRPRPVVVVPGAPLPRVAVPGEVPDAAALVFSLIHIYEFDNYTPATVDAATRALKARIAARAYARASEGLDRRAKVIVEGRMASHAVASPGGSVERTRDGTLAVAVEGVRRVFIADRLSREDRVRWRLELEPCAPTAANPHGLAVIAQTVEEVPDAARDR